MLSFGLLEERISKLFNLSKENDGTEFFRAVFFVVMLLVGFVFVFGFGVYNLAIGSVGSGMIEVAIGVAMFVNLWLFYRSKDTGFAASILVGIIMVLLWYLFVTGGIEKTGLVWYFTFPPGAIFLLGRKRGVRWCMVILVGTFALYWLGTHGVIPLSYDYVFLRQTILACILVGIFVYAYDTVREQSDQAIAQKKDELSRANIKLGETVEALHAAKSSVDKKIKEKTRELAEHLEELALANAKNEAVLASIGEGVMVVNAIGDMQFVNSAAEAIFRLPPGEALGKNTFTFFEVIDKEGVAVPRDAWPLARALAEKVPIPFGGAAGSLFCRRHDGTQFPIAGVSAPVLLNGKAIGGVSTFQDITAEVELDNTKSEFVSLASHQLRTPLTAIKGYATLLAESKRLSRDQKDFIGEIERANERMIFLINDLLNVSRIDLGVLSVSPENLILSSFADTVISELETEMKRKKISFERNYAVGMAEISADPSLLKIIFQNLLSNAVKYTSPKGTVSLAVSFDGEWYHIEVRDTGCGIPDDAQSKIFTKMYRADNATTADPEGTGLGLYLVKAIVDGVGGSIAFESKLNKGTTFHVRLPKEGMKAREGSKLIVW